MEADNEFISNQEDALTVDIRKLESYKSSENSNCIISNYSYALSAFNKDT